MANQSVPLDLSFSDFHIVKFKKFIHISQKGIEIGHISLVT